MIEEKKQLSDRTGKEQEKKEVGRGRPPIGKQFKPGQSGNPKGRPKGSISITSRIKEELGRIPEGQKVNYLEILIRKILHLALVKGDRKMIELMWDHIDGPAGRHILVDDSKVTVNQRLADNIILLDVKTRDKILKVIRGAIAERRLK